MRGLVNFTQLLPHKMSYPATRVYNFCTLIIMDVSQIDTYPLAFHLLSIYQVNNRLVRQFCQLLNILNCFAFVD